MLSWLWPKSESAEPQRLYEEQKQQRLAEEKKQQRLAEEKKQVEKEEAEERLRNLKTFVDNKRKLLMDYRPGTFHPEATQNYELPKEWNIVFCGPAGVGKSSLINTSHLAFHPEAPEYYEIAATYESGAHTGSLVFEDFYVGPPSIRLFDSKGWSVGSDNKHDDEASVSLQFMNGQVSVGKLISKDRGHLKSDLAREATEEKVFTIHGLIIVVSPKTPDSDRDQLAKIVGKIHNHNVHCTLAVTGKSYPESSNIDLDTLRAQLISSRVFQLDNYTDTREQVNEVLKRNLETEATLFRMYEQVLRSCEVNARYTCPQKASTTNDSRSSNNSSSSNSSNNSHKSNNPRN